MEFVELGELGVLEAWVWLFWSRFPLAGAYEPHFYPLGVLCTRPLASFAVLESFITKHKATHEITTGCLLQRRYLRTQWKLQREERGMANEGAVLEIQDELTNLGSLR